MSFITHVKREKSKPVFEFSDIERMRNYQFSLIDFLLYESRKHKDGEHVKVITDGILNEIKATEKWLKKATEIFIHDNNRKFQPNENNNNSARLQLPVL